MPNPDEVAEVHANGFVYDRWDWIEVEARIGNVARHIRLRVMEIGDISHGFKNVRLKVGDTATVKLAGRSVITDGTVTVRQVAYSATTHQIEIVVSTKTWRINNASPKLQQFTKASLSQIANAVLGPLGTSFYLSGNTGGADKPFERISTALGETVKQFIERMARMRDIHLTDDPQGRLVGLRGGTAPEGSLAATPVAFPAFPSLPRAIATLVEGDNIKELHGVMSSLEAVNTIGTVGQNFGNDEHGGSQASDVYAEVTNNLPATAPAIFQFAAEEPADKVDVQMRASHENAAVTATFIQVYITVQGWLMDNGTLWIEHVVPVQPFRIFSPMMFPNDWASLYLRGVSHRQNNQEGTITVLEFTLLNAIAPFGQIGGPDINDLLNPPNPPQT